MAAVDATIANATLNAWTGNASFTEAVTPLYIKLGSSAPTA